ncbi:MAG TPA: RNHCP domain-containing protein [Gemmatimonadales bacterium]|nr:RNHCP domain-containing protein [Gemmatimonadales bacterium]
MSRRDSRAVFTCIHCGASVPLAAFGTRHRNHCPTCLHSRHVDDATGDRNAGCGGAMEPLAIAVTGHRAEWRIVHSCRSCGRLRLNRIAGDDDERSLLRLARRPLEDPPFPVELIDRWS